MTKGEAEGSTGHGAARTLGEAIWLLSISFKLCAYSGSCVRTFGGIIEETISAVKRGMLLQVHCTSGRVPSSRCQGLTLPTSLVPANQLDRTLKQPGTVSALNVCSAQHTTTQTQRNHGFTTNSGCVAHRSFISLPFATGACPGPVRFERRRRVAKLPSAGQYDRVDDRAPGRFTDSAKRTDQRRGICSRAAET